MRIAFVPTPCTVAIRGIQVNAALRVEAVVAQGSSGNVVMCSRVFRLLCGLPCVCVRPVSRYDGYDIQVRLDAVSSFARDEASELRSAVELLKMLPAGLLGGAVFECCRFNVQGGNEVPRGRELVFLLDNFVRGDRYFEIGRILQVDALPVLRVRVVIQRVCPFVIIPRVVKVVTIYRRLTVVSMGLVSSLFMEIPHKASVTGPPFAGDAYAVANVARVVRGDL